MHFTDGLVSLAFRLVPRRSAVFPDGLGGGDLDALIAGIPAPADPVPAIAPAWGAPRREGGVVYRTAELASPSAASLPEGARRMFLELVEPEGGADRTIVWLQMWGDEGRKLRRGLAVRLAARGVATVLPVHPFYGRRRVHAVGAPIRTAEEFLRMGLVAIEETRSLLDRLRRDRVVGLGGFSMGSGFSVGASTTLPFPVALTLAGAAPSPAKAFTTGVLERRLPPRLRAEDRPRLAQALDGVSALRRPVLDHHRRAVIVAAREDGFVPVEEAVALAEHWRGAELRVVDGGHATLWFRRKDAMVDAVERAFERHEAALGLTDRAPSDRAGAGPGSDAHADGLRDRFDERGAVAPLGVPQEPRDVAAE